MRRLSSLRMAAVTREDANRARRERIAVFLGDLDFRFWEAGFVCVWCGTSVRALRSGGLLRRKGSMVCSPCLGVCLARGERNR